MDTHAHRHEPTSKHICIQVHSRVQAQRKSHTQNNVRSTHPQTYATIYTWCKIISCHGSGENIKPSFYFQRFNCGTNLSRTNSLEIVFIGAAFIPMITITEPLSRQATVGRQAHIQKHTHIHTHKHTKQLTYTHA